MRRVGWSGAWVLSLFLLLQHAGCSGSGSLDQPGAGKSSSYQPGTPDFDIECEQAPGDSLPAVDVYMSIPFPSLIFEKAGEGFRSLAEITARLLDRNSGQVTGEVSWAETTFVERYESTQSFEPKTLRRRIAVSPGSYQVDVTLEDNIDARKSTRSQSVRIIDPGSADPALGRISLLTRKQDGTIVPQISFFVPAWTDSIACIVRAYNFSGTPGSRIAMRVLSFVSDTSTALVPYYYPLLPVPLGHTMIDAGRPDTVYVAAGSVPGGRGGETIEFLIPPVRRGLCRIEIRAVTRNSRGGRDTVLGADRYYSIQGPGFPRPVTLGELIAAAVYIATPKEISELREARGPEKQREEFEAFWLSLAGSQVRASALIKKYYGRVEEANRLFTFVREGWKTDRGMLFIMLGPPTEVRNQFETQTWYYDFGGNANDNTFVFQRVTRFIQGMTVEDFYLYRASWYEQSWGRMLYKWRTGDPP